MLHSQRNQENIILYKEKHSFKMVFSFTYGSCSEKQWSFVSLKVLSKTPEGIVLVLPNRLCFLLCLGLDVIFQAGQF